MEIQITATQATAADLRERGLEVDIVKKIGEGSPDSLEMISDDQIDLVINTLTKGKIPERDGFRIRRSAVEMGIPCLTSLDTTHAMLKVLQEIEHGERIEYKALQDYQK